MKIDFQSFFPSLPLSIGQAPCDFNFIPGLHWLEKARGRTSLAFVMSWEEIEL